MPDTHFTSSNPRSPARRARGWQRGCQRPRPRRSPPRRQLDSDPRSPGRRDRRRSRLQGIMGYVREGGGADSVQRFKRTSGRAGRCYGKPRPDLHQFDSVRTSVQFRAASVDAGSSEQGPRRLEHRHQCQPQRRAEFRARPDRRARRTYAWADEYMDIVYKLWEGSWDEDALLADKRTGIYADPEKVHRIYHEGRRYRVMGPHLTTPSPQRTPVLYQAGSSKVGRAFAARHAEGTFILSPNEEGARRAIAETRSYAAAAGRDPSDLLFIQGLSFVVGSTEEEAWRKSRGDRSVCQLRRSRCTYQSGHGYRSRAPRSGSADRSIQHRRFTGLHSAVRRGQSRKEGDRRRSRQFASYNGRIVGTPEGIADQLERWQDAGIDGVNVMYQTTPGSFRTFIEHVIPVLQKRGLAQREYAPGTLRSACSPADPRV